MEIILLRHAQTSGNLEKRYIGATDEPLCKTGVHNAIKSGIIPHVRFVYASTKIRTVQTATIKFPFARISLIPGLREMDFGVFEGRTADEMRDDSQYREWVDSGCQDKCPGGEGRAGFSARTCVAFAEVIAESLRMYQRQTIIVAHGGTIMAVMERFAKPSKDYFEWNAPHCGGYSAYLNEETWERVPVLTEVKRLW